MELNISHKLEKKETLNGMIRKIIHTTHTHLFLSSESTTTCLFFCGGGDSRVWRTADTFSLVVTLVTVAVVTEWVSSDCWVTLTADDS